MDRENQPRGVITLNVMVKLCARWRFRTTSIRFTKPPRRAHLASFQGHSDNFEAIRRTAADQDCRTQIGVRDWRLKTGSRRGVGRN
jgi:hypothetical protein